MSHDSNHKFPSTSILDRIRRAPAVPIIALLGVTSLGLASCTDEVAAEKPPVTATETPGTTEAPTPSTPDTPVETDTPEPTTSDPVETTPPTGDVINGIDTSNLSPEAQARAETLTPEFIASLETPEQRDEAFSLELADIQLDNGKSPAENYAELSFVNLASMYRAGCTPEERTTEFGQAGYTTYREFNQAEVLLPTLTATFGEEGAANSPLKDYSFAKRCFELTYPLELGRDLAKGDPLDAAYGELKDNPDAASIPDYSIAFTYNPDSLEVITDGSGQFGDALSVKYDFGFKETMPYTPEQLDILGKYAGVQVAEFNILEGSIMVQIEGAVDDGDGEKLTTNVAYSEMTSNQLEDGTISE